MSLAISTAIGTVADLIAIDDTSLGARPKARAVTPATIMVPSEPATRPQAAGTRLLKNT
jgi:hypothetical protein